MTLSTYVYGYITLVRHGETSENVGHVIQGHMNTELSPNGLKQAKNLKQLTDGLSIDFAISSDLNRAKNTATELIEESILQTDSRLRERNFGDLNGKARIALQQFTEQNANTGAGCQGWLAVGGECAHQMAHRTHAFLINLCQMFVQRVESSKEKGCYPKSSPASSSITNSLFSMPPMPTPVLAHFINENTAISHENFAYAGHALLVSHGGWIRQLFRLLSIHSQLSIDFPRVSVDTVMANCGVSVIGIAFNLQALHAYATRPSFATQFSPIPVFGGTTDQNGTIRPSESCPFLKRANPAIPLATVCYLYNHTVDNFETALKATNQSLISTGHSQADPAVKLCSQMEIIFSDDGDEYAGIPSNSA